MPAIRYRHNGSFRIVNHVQQPHDLIAVRLKDGKFEFVPWHGFICTHATKHIAGKKAKIAAQEVTREDGLWRCTWQHVSKEQHVFGWLIERYTEERMIVGIYGVVGDDGWPIIIDKEPAPKIKRLDATVTSLTFHRKVS